MEAKPKSEEEKEPARHKTDINAAWILAIVACLAALLVALHFITSGLIGRFKGEPTQDEWTSRLARSENLRGPPFTRLQISPAADLQGIQDNNKHL